MLSGMIVSCSFNIVFMVMLSKVVVSQHLLLLSSEVSAAFHDLIIHTQLDNSSVSVQLNNMIRVQNQASQRDYFLKNELNQEMKVFGLVKIITTIMF